MNFIFDDLGLTAAIEWQTEDFQQRTGIICTVTIEPNEISLDDNQAIALFRIFQEALTNIARHSQAKKVVISLTQQKETVTLKVSDDGIGITKKSVQDSKSFGLMGIRERASYCGGNAEITGTPGKGTTVTVVLPIKDKETND